LIAYSNVIFIKIKISFVLRMKNRRYPVSEVIINRLIAWGITHIFGIIGDYLTPLLKAIQGHPEICFIAVRHEEAAAFMASGYYKWSGKMAVCMTTAGPGFLHLLNGLYDAALDHSVVLVISGDVTTGHKNITYAQDVNSTRILSEISLHSVTVNERNAIGQLDEAYRLARIYRGVSHLSIPIDIQEKIHDETFGKPYFQNILTVPESTDEFTEVINQTCSTGGKIVILMGRGCVHATEEVKIISEKIAAPICQSFYAVTLIPEYPSVLGCSGFLGCRPSNLALKECDLLIILGSNFYYKDYLVAPKCVQIELDPKRLGSKCPLVAGLVGDVKYILYQIIPKLDRNPNRKFLKKYMSYKRDWEKYLYRFTTIDTTPLHPAFVISKISQYVSPEAHIAIDTGEHTGFVSRFFHFTGSQKIAISGSLQSMGNGLPFSIASQISHPTKQAIAFVGDGGFTMLLGELATVKKYNLNIKIFIMKNNLLGFEINKQKLAGMTPFACDLEPIKFDLFAQACGLSGYSVKTCRQLTDVLEEIFSKPEAAIVSIEIDPEIHLEIF